MTETITWIPVSERLPVGFVEVLLARDGYAGDVGWYDDRESKWLCRGDEDGPFQVRDVTHWAEMPKGPVWA